MKDAGLTAMLNYRFNEHWEAAVFAQKSLIKPKVPPYLYWMGDVGDKIGASVRYNINPSLSIGLSVWRGTAP
jgi:outer membrane scaffolding protein for murein synthesis (MipA/OmpV family)